MGSAKAVELLIQQSLKKRMPNVTMTKFLLLANIGVFVAMLCSGAGFWHSPNQIQLAWGANFAPATEDGQWWRLGSAMFLHFGALHLAMNMFALWDGGQLVERMYGHIRFFSIYIISGLLGNLLSLVIQGNAAVSGGASGAIFGLYGCLLVYLWLERNHLDRMEFRWLFWGAIGFSILTISLGFIIKGIDNSAHIGGFLTGMFCGIVFKRPYADFSESITTLPRWIALAVIVIASILLVWHIPKPAYHWRDEVALQQHIQAFMQDDKAAAFTWEEIVKDGQQGNADFADLAGRVETDIADHYQDSFETLSKLPNDPDLPSAKQLEQIIKYAQSRRDASLVIAEKLRRQAKKKDSL